MKTSKLNRFLHENYWVWVISRLPFYPLLIALNIVNILEDLVLNIRYTNWKLPLSRNYYSKLKIKLDSDNEMLRIINGLKIKNNIK